MTLEPFSFLVILYIVFGAAIGSQYAVKHGAKSLERLVWALCGANFWPLMLMVELHYYWNREKAEGEKNGAEGEP